jgi:hypothetical protein
VRTLFVIVGLAWLAGLLSVVAMLRAGARRERHERAWLDKALPHNGEDEPDEPEVEVRVVRHPSGGMRPVTIRRPRPPRSVPPGPGQPGRGTLAW